MKKRIIAFVCAAVLVLGCVGEAMGHIKMEHDAFVKKMLFGQRKRTIQNEKAINAVNTACALSLDQFKNNGKENFQDLGSVYKVPRLPKNISSIKLDVHAEEHRKFTHKGWDFDYSSQGDLANWPVRKQIILDAVGKYFPKVRPLFFGFSGKPTTKQNSFAALIYYLHVLYDYEEIALKKNSWYYNTYIDHMIPFANAGSNINDPDLFFELKRHCEILFGKNATRNYQDFLDKLDDLARQARMLPIARKGGKMTQSDFETFQTIVGVKENGHYPPDSLIGLLQKYLPDLLKNEPFFRDVFFPNQ